MVSMFYVIIVTLDYIYCNYRKLRHWSSWSVQNGCVRQPHAPWVEIDTSDTRVPTFPPRSTQDIRVTWLISTITCSNYNHITHCAKVCIACSPMWRIVFVTGALVYEFVCGERISLSEKYIRLTKQDGCCVELALCIIVVKLNFIRCTTGPCNYVRM